MPFPDFVGGECEKVTVTKEESRGDVWEKKNRKLKKIYSLFITTVS